MLFLMKNIYVCKYMKFINTKYIYMTYKYSYDI